MSKHLKSMVAAFVIGFAAIYAGFVLQQKLNVPATPPADLPLLWPNPKSLETFRLSDQHGQPFDLERVRGQWTFWFFGYTHCPDVCPITLSVMHDVAEMLEAAAPQSPAPQTVFVSVDPARDRPEQLARYVEFFDPDFVAVTGEEPALQTLTRQFGILYLLQPPDENGNYLVDHTAAILMTDPEARFVALFSAPHDAKAISEKVRRIQDFLSG